MTVAPAPRREEDFTGFPPGGLDFLFELQMHQSREWFKENRARYERLWVEPMDALMVALAGRLVDLFPEITPLSRKVFRIQRDTRFSRDKTPYKTHVAAHLPLRPVYGQQWSRPGIYVHFGLDEHVLSLGQWELDRDLLTRFREAVAGERYGPALQSRLTALLAGGFALSSHEDALKRVPAPYAADHPRADLLKLKGLAVSVLDVPEDLLPAVEILDWIEARVRQAAPVVQWLDEALWAS